MKTLKTEKLIFIDVDDTLIMWTWPEEANGKTIKFKDPYSNSWLQVYPNRPNITLLKEKLYRGFTIIVWSAGGYAHAEAVVKALKLASYVDYVMTKPTAYVDDRDVSDWFPKRIYLDPEMRYKIDRED